MSAPPLSIAFDPYPIAVYRVVSHYVKPPATVVDLCCGEARWTLWLERDARYRVIRCDLSGSARCDVVSDLASPPFRHGVADCVLADLPYPYHRARGYRARVRDLGEYSSLLRAVCRSATWLLRPRGFLALKTADFWESESMYPGIWAVHGAMKDRFDLRDVVVLALKPWIHRMGEFKHSIRMHNYLLVYQRR